MSNSKRPHGLQPPRLLHPWDFPGKNTGVGCHCLLSCLQELYPNLFDKLTNTIAASSLNFLSLLIQLCCILIKIYFSSFLSICKASSDNHFAFLHFFFLGMVLITASYTMSQTSIRGLFQARVLEWGAIAFSVSFLTHSQNV